MIGRNRFLKAAGLKPVFSIGFSAAKIFTGLLYTWIMIRFIPSAKADIDLFFGDGLDMYNRFWQDPAGFPAYLAEVFTISDFRLGNTDSDFIRTVFDGIKFIHFLLDFLSGGNVYTNVLLFNGLAAWLFLRCWVYLKRIFGHPWLGNWVFLFPSAFFFTSVILKEGIELCLIAAIIPALINLRKSRHPIRLLGILLLFALLFFFKYLIAATFVLLLVLYGVYLKFPAKRTLFTTVFLTVLVFVFFGAGYLFPSLNFPNYIIERRLEFLELEANTTLNMRNLEPTPASFLKALPEAFKNVFFRPLPGEVEKPFYYLFMVELYALWGLIIWGVVKRIKKKLPPPGAEALAWLVFSLINLLIIGYTITNTGAIIRYRSIFLPGLGYFVWFWVFGKTFFENMATKIPVFPAISGSENGTRFKNSE